MKVRSFDWRDLAALGRVRHESVYLHSAFLLTRGPLLIPGALVSSMAPGMGIFTSVCNDDSAGQILFGQIVHPSGSQCSQLTFLAPGSALNPENLQPLIDHLSAHAVERGAFRMLADAEDRSEAFEALRETGFAIYARQRIWRLKDGSARSDGPLTWQTATDRDLIAVRSLYYNLIPGLVQQVEPFPTERLKGLIFRRGDELLAYVELRYGHRGIWAQPFIHPDAEDVLEKLIELLPGLPHRLSRPIFLCVRSYQSWLEPAIEHLGAETSPRQAMMVKHLALPQKALRPYALPAIEGGHPEVTAPIAQSQVGRLEVTHPVQSNMEL